MKLTEILDLCIYLTSQVALLSKHLFLAILCIVSLTACNVSIDNDEPTPPLNPLPSSIDAVPPVLTLVGENTIIHPLGQEYIDLGATALDNLDGVVAVTSEGEVNINTLGSYNIRYSAVDSEQNVSTINRTIKVQDLESPVISLIGPSEVTLIKNAVYSELGATALDNVDGVVIVSSPIGELNTGKVGQYFLTYYAEDRAGNRTHMIRTINVVVPKPFITTWKTDNPGVSENNQLKISTDKRFLTYNYDVDWGDGNIDENQTGDITHTYDVAGIYTVTISGVFPKTYFDYNEANGYSHDNEKLLTVESWGDMNWQSMRSSFAFCKNLLINATDSPDLSNVVDMGYMFFNASSFNSDINHWQVSNIKDMSNLFRNATNFNQDLNQWDVSSVISMNGMFKDAIAFNGKIGNWDTRSLSAMSYMFSGALVFDQDLSFWDVSSVTFMKGVFEKTSEFNGDISQWDVSSVKDMSFMFSNAHKFNQAIGEWDVSAVTNMTYMFYAAEKFDQSLMLFDVSSVKNMRNMFGLAATFNQDISQWNVSSVTDVSYMFYSASAFNQKLGSWNVSSVTDFSGMFLSASLFNQDLSQWQLNSAKYMKKMFAYAHNFNQDIQLWDVSNVVDMADMFKGISLSVDNYNGLLSSWSALPLQENVSFDAGNSMYSSDYQAVRDILTFTYGWSLKDAGVSP